MALYIDELRLTDVGLQAINDADNQGIHIRPVMVIAGDYTGTDTTAVPSALLGNEVYRGPLSYVEVLSKNACRFSFRIPQAVPAGVSGSSCTIGEFLVLLDDGRVFGHVTLREPQLKVNTFGIQFSLLVVSQFNIGKVVDVQMSEHATIPCVSDLEMLPAPISSDFNVVAVFNLKKNSDSTSSPALAYRYGAGGMEWGFSEHDRLFSGILTDRWLTDTQFKFDDYDQDLTEGDTVVVQVISGSAMGNTRHYTYTAKTLVLDGTPIPALDASNTVAVWRKSLVPTNSQTTLTWPENSDVPDHWVLTRGAGNSLVFAPPTTGGANTVTGANLYIEPSKLVVVPITTTATPSSLRYALAQVPDSESDVFLALSGISQSRSSFFTNHEGIELSEAVPKDLLMDVRVFTHEPSTGHRTDCLVLNVTGDGITDTYDLPTGVDQSSQVFAIVQRILQPVTSYSVQSNKIRFTEPLPIGRPATIYCLIPVAKVGYSTRLRHVQLTVNSDTTDFELPTVPESEAYVIFNEQGALLHSDAFAVVGNLLVTADTIPKGRYVEITVIENVQAQGSADNSLNGVITHVDSSPDGMVFKRHNMPSLKVPAPILQLSQGKGIRIDGKYPHYTIVNTMAEAASLDNMRSYSIHKRLSDVEEIIVTQRITFVGDIVITATADFGSSLGPGFSTSTGLEQMQFMVAAVPVNSNPPEYARKVRGTNEAGFAVVDTSITDCTAFSNASITQMYNISASNHPAKYVDVVAKMRVANAIVAAYGSELSCCLSIMVYPK